MVLSRYYVPMTKNANQSHDLLERLANLVRADARAICNNYGMRPVQLEALGYLTRCNHYSDTPQAVTDYLGLTKGTVSQTLKVLEQKGFISKRTDKDDKRVVHLKPTAIGKRLAQRSMPAASLDVGFNELSKAEGQQIADSLSSLLRTVQKANGLRTFAPCHSCRFNQKRADGYFCGLTLEPLAVRDVTLLCREHQYPLTITA